MALYTPATPANMKRFEEEHPGHHAVAMDRITGDTFSGTAGDYWDLPENEPLRGDQQEPLILVVPTQGFNDALTGRSVQLKDGSLA